MDTALDFLSSLDLIRWILLLSLSALATVGLSLYVVLVLAKKVGK